MIVRNGKRQSEKCTIEYRETINLALGTFY